MANITKRAAKRLATHLNGEPVELALLLEPRGQYGVGGMVASAVATRTTMRAMGRRDAADRDAEGGVAATFPTGSVALVVTPWRVLASVSNGITFKEPSFAIDRQRVRVAGVEGKGLGKRLTLVFDDGTGVVMDAQRGQPFNELIAALGTLDARG